MMGEAASRTIGFQYIPIAYFAAYCKGNNAEGGIPCYQIVRRRASSGY